MTQPRPVPTVTRTRELWAEPADPAPRPPAGMRWVGWHGALGPGRAHRTWRVLSHGHTFPEAYEALKKAAAGRPGVLQVLLFGTSPETQRRVKQLRGKTRRAPG